MLQPLFADDTTAQIAAGVFLAIVALVALGILIGVLMKVLR